jgi:hypothetical protein
MSSLISRLAERAEQEELLKKEGGKVTKIV